MNLTSLPYLLLVAAALLLYHGAPGPRGRKAALCAANCAFFALSGWQFALCCGGVLLAAFFAARAAKRLAGRARLWFCRGAAAAVLALLCVFKYTDFVRSWFSLPALGIPAPLGLSFYTLACIGYLLEVGGGREPEQRFSGFFLFAGSFFLVTSGPIPQSEQLSLYQSLPAYNNRLFCLGMTRMLWGLFQKLVVANALAASVNHFFANTATESPLRVAVAALFYSFQLYFDFAGYSDMALGTAAMFGLELPENFCRPYLAVDIQDFWRRWHISLSGWLQRYVYIPLGGSRKGAVRTLANILLVFLVSGLWHGAAWTFVFWGLLHGGANLLHRLLKPLWRRLGLAGLTRRSALARFAARLALFGFVTCAWVFFRAPGMEAAKDVFFRLPQISEIPTYLLATMRLPAGKVLSCYLGGALILLRDLLAENGRDPLLLVQDHPRLRTALFAALYLAIALFGVFSGSSFLYHAF